MKARRKSFLGNNSISCAGRLKKRFWCRCVIGLTWIVVAVWYNWPRPSTPPPPPPAFVTTPQELERHRAMKTLVIILGDLRGGEPAWQSLKRNVLEPNNHADLALLIGDSPRPEIRNASLFSIAKYHWPVKEYSDWAEALDVINPNWRNIFKYIRKERSDMLGGIAGYPKMFGSGAVIFALRYFLSQKIRELRLTSVYDRFVITRSDHYFLCTHDLSKLNNHYMWLPAGEESRHGGETDRHLVVSNRHILQAIDILPPLFRNPKRYKDVLKRGQTNPEQFLALRWAEEKIPLQKFARVMFTCAVSGDTTRHKCMSATKVVEGVHLKYGNEYNESYSGCGKQISNANFLTPITKACLNSKIRPPSKRAEPKTMTEKLADLFHFFT